MFCSKITLRRLLESTRDKFNMGYVLSKVLWFLNPTDYDVPNNTTGITPREKDIVQRTWKLVRTDTRNNGIKLFLMFFEQYPEYQKLFKEFSDVSQDKLASNGRLLGHATAVMYAVTSVVDNLEYPECLVELLQKIGSSHKPRNLTGQHFQNLKGVIILFLEDVLGTSIMNARAKEAWTKTLGVANSVIIKSLEG